ncbi:hypothetical protein RCZ04_20510 [Capnocytophaga sp. HP1101]
MRKIVFVSLILWFATTANSYAQKDEDKGMLNIPFAIIEQKPMFEACKDVDKNEQERCFRQHLNEHIITHLRYPQKALKKGIQDRVVVEFAIRKNGTVKVIEVTGTDEDLKAEAKFLIESLPCFIPARQHGKPIEVCFKYPINFTLAD